MLKIQKILFNKIVEIHILYIFCKVINLYFTIKYMDNIYICKSSYYYTKY